MAVNGEVKGQGGCEWRSEAFVKIQKKNFFLGGGSGQGDRLGGCQGGCERRIEAFVKIPPKKFFWGGSGGGGGGGAHQVWGSGWM